MAPTMLQIRNLPDDLHRRLKIRAAEDGVSMSDWVKARIEEGLARPSLRELLDRIDTHVPVDGDFDVAEIIREGRGPMLSLAAEPEATYRGRPTEQAPEDPDPS